MPGGFFIGPLEVRFYGIIIVSGAVLGAWLASREAKRRGHNPDIVWDLLIYLMIGGIIGARIWHIFTPSPNILVRDTITGEMVNPYFAGGTVHLLDILAIWKGGLGIPGAVIAGAVVLYFYSRVNQLNFAEWADIIAPSLALGQSIGRWGNYFNQELYGAPTNLPWKIFIDPAHRLAGYLDVEYYHPLFFYESIWNFFNVCLLIWLSRRHADRLKTGDIFLIYLIVYPVGRFLLDFLRLDASMVGGLNINQTVMGIVALCATASLYFRHRKANIPQ
ncbi:MAG TPA: prolipoprotein diacylglyceryl transferase [Anaerolineales bacterium]|nr:prolipoprotein diacylglyceryl transferase [Anaerolineales bacterium]